MGTYYQPGRIIDYSIGAFTKSIQDAEKELLDQERLRKNEEKNEQLRINRINEELTDLEFGISQLPEYETVTLDDEIKEKLQSEYERVYRLGVESIGGDNREYLRAVKALEQQAKDAGIFMAALNEEGKLWDERGNLRSDAANAPISTLDPRRGEFVNDFNKGGGNIKAEIVNGTWVLSQGEGEDKFVLNTKEYLNNKQPLIEYNAGLGSLEESVRTLYADEMDKLAVTINEQVERDGKITKTTIEDFTIGSNNLRKNILDPNGGVADLFNSKTWQSIPMSYKKEKGVDILINPTNIEEQKRVFQEYIADRSIGNYNKEARFVAQSTRPISASRTRTSGTTSKDPLPTVEYTDIQEVIATNNQELEKINEKLEKAKKEGKTKNEGIAKAAQNAVVLKNKKDLEKILNNLEGDFVNREIRKGNSKYQIQGFDIIEDSTDLNKTKIVPFYISAAGDKKPIAKYSINALDQLTQDLQQADKTFERKITSGGKDPLSLGIYKIK
jgi:hypothetical protein